MTVKPFIKWAGGKTFLLPYLEHFVTDPINTYYEPMVGGGALFFHLASKKHFKRAVIADVSPLLINAYQCLQNKPSKVIDILKSLATRHKNLLQADKSADNLYYKIRDTLHCDNKETRAAKFIYLNKTCYNGLYRVNKAGEFNVPFGEYKNPTICDEQNLLAVHQALKNVTILESPFEMALTGAHKGDLVYFDPPYIPVSKGSFVGYTSNGFSLKDHKRIAKVIKKLSTKGVKVILSNSACATTRKIFKDYYRVEVASPRRINSIAKKRDLIKEYIITP